MPAAATDFHVNGPTSILWRKSGTGSLTPLGYTDNDDLIRISMRDHYRTFSRNDTGDMIAEAVLSGTTMTIDFTMVAWNQDQLEDLLSLVRSGSTTGTIASEGLFAKIGNQVVNGSNPTILELQILPTNVGATIFTFPRVMLSSGPEVLDLGNTVKRLAFSFITVAPASGTFIATTTAVTAV